MSVHVPIYVYVCAYICVHVCICVCDLYVYVCVCVYVFVCVYVYVCMYVFVWCVCVCICVYVCTCVFICMCIYSYMCVCMYVCVFLSLLPILHTFHAPVMCQVCMEGALPHDSHSLEGRQICKRLSAQKLVGWLCASDSPANRQLIYSLVFPRPL